MSDTTLPSPLVPAEVDLRDFQYMELDVRVLRDSRFAAQVSGDAFRAGVLLWCAAWHQVPAGSLPDDDIELANLAGYGRFTKEWRKVRAEALTKFVKCSDGRLYHQEVSEKARTAWNAKLVHHYDRARDRLRKVNKARASEGLAPLPELTFEQWNSERLARAIPMEKADASAGIPEKDPPERGGIPPENALKGRGNGEGEGTEREKETSFPNTATSDEVARRPAADPPQLALVEPSAEAPSGPPDCPHREVLALWAEVLPAMPQHDPERWRGAKADHLRARWRETATAKGWTSKAEGLRYFRKLFGYIGQSLFLTGRAPPSTPGKRPFVIELEWLVVASNWDKVHEGKYHPETEAA